MVMVMVMMIMTRAVLIAFHLKRVVCGRWVEPRSQAPNIPMLSTAATPALPSTGGTTKFSFDYGGNLGGGGEVYIPRQIALHRVFRERLGSLDNLSLLEMFGSNSPESTNSALLAFR